VDGGERGECRRLAAGCLEPWDVDSGRTGGFVGEGGGISRVLKVANTKQEFNQNRRVDLEMCTRTGLGRECCGRKRILGKKIEKEQRGGGTKQGLSVEIQGEKVTDDKILRGECQIFEIQGKGEDRV